MRGGWRYGAGRPGWKAKAEQSLPLDVRAMHHRGILRRSYSGTWSWTWNNGESAGSIGYEFDNDSLLLRYAIDGQSRVQHVRVVRTRCHYGGSRPWFCCPVCNRRVAVLYHRGGRFACRRCQRVAYLSQSEDVTARAWRRQRKAESRLIDGYGRPKGMHTATYKRLMEVIVECETVKDERFWAFAQRMGL